MQELEWLLPGLGTLGSSTCLSTSPSVKQKEIMSTVSGLLVSLQEAFDSEPHSPVSLIVHAFPVSLFPEHQGQT